MEEDHSANVEKCTLNIQRSIFKQSEFNNAYQNTVTSKKNSTWSSSIKSLLKNCDPRKILNIFSILNVIVSYNFKQNIICDIFSGITVGIMQIPQALAYGALTSLGPAFGLYTSFIPSLTYIIFGTSRHLSVGTFAVIALMVYSSINRMETEFLVNKIVLANNSDELRQNFTNYMTEDQVLAFRIKIATSLCFWCGTFQVLFAVFRFGFIIKFMSQPMLRAFNTAAAFLVLTTQMKDIFGIYTKPKPHRFFQLAYTYFTIIENITSINWIALGISVSSISLMLFSKLYLSVKLKKHLKGVPIPVELFIIIVATAISYYFDLGKTHSLGIVGHIPSGMPSAYLPHLDYITSIGIDAATISVVAIASSISQADLYARKHQYKLNINKEIFALGMANICGSFFQCFTSCGALGRTALADSSGGKTQLVTVISSSIVVLVLLFLSPFLQSLPNACLGSIIIVALLDIYKQVSDIGYYWKLDNVSLVTWIITFFSTILLGTEIGLFCGFVAVLFLNTYRNKAMDAIEVGQVENFEIFTDVNTFDTHRFNDLKIIRPSQSLLYVNCDIFHKKLNVLCPLKAYTEPADFIDNLRKNCSCKSTEEAENQNFDCTILNKARSIVKTIILDFSLVAKIDEAGVKTLIKIENEYKNDNVTILFASVNDEVFKFFGLMKCKWDAIIYLSTKDALDATLADQC